MKIGSILQISPQRILGFFRKRLKFIDPIGFELHKIKKYPRFKEGETKILGKEFKFIDSASFLFMFKEIFINNIYKFYTNDDDVFIIDCGANIGLSILYFKKLYPDSEIIAFEPDPYIFDVLKTNINTFKLDNVTLINKALSNKIKDEIFYYDHADGGRLWREGSNEKNKYYVKTDRLKKYINRKVNFLKIDIEGAETIVLQDSIDILKYVEKIFIEYHSFVTEKQSLGELLQILSKAGFRYLITTPGLYSEQPFVKIRKLNSMDLQLNIYGYREDK